MRKAVPLSIGITFVVFLVAARADCQVRPVDPPPVRVPPTVNLPPSISVPPAIRNPPTIKAPPSVSVPPTVRVPPSYRVPPAVRAAPSARVAPSTGGGSPPPRRYNSSNVVLPSYDQEEERLRELIRRYNGDEALREYLHTANEMREKMDMAREIVFAITAEDPYHEIAVFIVKRLEEKAVAHVYKQLAAQLARIEARVEGWGVTDNRYTRAQREEALAELQRCEQWLDNVTREALVEANSRINQRRGSGSPSAEPAVITISSSPAAATPHLPLGEGTG